MAATGATTLPLGSEIIPETAPAPAAGGAAPWEREGASHRSPDDPESRARAERWKRRAGEDGEGGEGGDDRGNREDRQRRAEERRARRKEREEQKEAERIKSLEQNARRMYLLGFFALPLLWLVSVLYFHKDYKSAEPNPVIKRCALVPSVFFCILVTLCFRGLVY